MDKVIKLLQSSVLFQGCNMDELSEMVRCLEPALAVYGKDEAICGDLTRLGFIAEGKIAVKKEDLNGNSVTLDILGAGDFFGAGFVSPVTLGVPLSFWALSQTTVALIDYERIITICPQDCPYHRRLMSNIVSTLSEKLVSASQKILILQHSTIRGKLMAFFELYMKKVNSRRFSLPLNRSELAEYIGVNRSAMSRELNLMHSKGLIEIKGNMFHVPENARIDEMM